MLYLAFSDGKTHRVFSPNAKTEASCSSELDDCLLQLMYMYETLALVWLKYLQEKNSRS